MTVLEVVAEYGIAIAFIAIVVWLRNNSAQHARKKQKGIVLDGAVGKKREDKS